MGRTQQLEALQVANKRRHEHSTLKAAVHSGYPVSRALFDPRAESGKLPVGQLLKAQHYWGDYRNRLVLGALKIKATTPVAHLSDAQRSAIARLARKVAVDGAQHTA